MSPPKLNTEQLLQLCREGKHHAQLEIYNRYYKAMYNVSIRIVKDAFEAEDIMQESFLSAYTKLHNYKGGEVAFGAWLKKIVVNNSIRHYRKQKKNEKIPLDDVMYKVEDNDTSDPDHEFTKIKAQKVLKTMKMLKESYRISLTLHLIEGYDYEEVSEILGISYANCRTTISRAKESLRRKLLEA